jgi:peroxiredoxin
MLSLRNAVLALTVIGGLAGFGMNAQAQVITGEAAPDYTFSDINGTSHSISEFKGKIVVLEWTNPGCPFVKKWYSKGDMQNLQKTLVEDPNVIWVAINSSGKGKEGYVASDVEMKKWTTEVKFAGTAYVRDPEGTFGHLYGAKTTPHMFVIDQDGKVAYQGAIDNIPTPDQADIAKAENYVAKAVLAVRGGVAPKTVNTPSYGCSVKYADAPAAAAAPFDAKPAAPTAPVPATPAVAPVTK